MPYLTASNANSNTSNDCAVSEESTFEYFETGASIDVVGIFRARPIVGGIRATSMRQRVVAIDVAPVVWTIHTTALCLEVQNVTVGTKL